MKKEAKKKTYHEPLLTIMGKVIKETHGAVGSTCDGNGTLGSGSNSSANACTQ